MLLFAVIYKSMAFKDSPLSNEMTMKQLSHLNMRVDNVVDESGWDESVFESYTDNQLAGAEECNSILVGKPTGNIYFNKGTILQEVKVENVIRGTCKYEKIWLQNGLRSTLAYDGNDVIIKGMDRNFMQEDCEYLLFCTPSGVNRYSDRKIYTEAEGMWFGCYNLTRDSDILITEDNKRYHPNAEFYTSSQRVLQCYNEAKKKLIQSYIGWGI